MRSISQIDSLVTLSDTIAEVEIKAAAVSKNHLDRDLAPLSSSISDIINVQSGWYMRENSPGNLSTLSIRGLSTKYAEVRWKGVRLNSRMNGFLDLNLLSANVFNKIELGDAHAIYLDTEEREAFTDVGIYAGSFRNQGAYVYAHISKPLFTTSVSLDLNLNRNNFSFINYSDEELFLSNAETESIQISSDTYYKTFKEVNLNFQIWYHYALRQIPPTMLQSESIAFQEDNGTKAIFIADKKFKKFRPKFYTSVFTENIVYNDSSASILAENEALTALVAGELNYAPSSHWSIKVSPDLERTSAYSDSYLDIVSGQSEISEWHTSLSANVDYRGNKGLDISLSSMIASVNGQSMPFRYSSDLGYDINKKIRLEGSYRNTYIRPTINDRFWIRGADPDLLTERAQMLDAGLVLNLLKPLELKTLYFRNRIKDEIRWVPGDIFWEVTNLGEYVSEGIESAATLKLQWNHLRLNLLSHYQWVIRSSTADNGMNLYPLYIPEHKWTQTAEINRDRWTLRSSQHYISKVYTRTDGGSSLDSYFLADLMLSRRTSIMGDEFSLGFRTNNIFNRTYQMFQHRPMPGRNYMISIKHTFINE